MDIDDEGKLRNVMWIHPRSIAAYEDFNDVVSFDTTYLVNKYRMPFATVVGVNHHHQSTLLGCCLLSHEDSDSLRWFFKNKLNAMGGVKPTTILTDQCESIRGAVREVVPETIHRLCLWHILCKTSEKFKHVTEFSKATSAFRQLIFNCRSIEEFEAGWAEFIVEYRLQNNRWLRDLYDERESWVHVYLNSYFWAGMLSTQRSESMNAFFDGYIHPKSTLKQYEIALTDKVHKEMRADYNSRIRPLKMTKDFKWAQQFGELYTNNVLEIFQAEIDYLWGCNSSPNTNHDMQIERDEVTDTNKLNVWFRRELTYTVEYCPSGGYFQCSCRKFESKGILCTHILKILTIRNIQKFNERYMKDRYPHMTEQYKRYQQLERVFQRCTDKAYQHPNLMDLIEQKLNDLENEVENTNPTSIQRETAEGNNSQPLVLDPDIVQSRGRPRSLRFKSRAEQNAPRRGRGRGRGRGPQRTSNVT